MTAVSSGFVSMRMLVALIQPTKLRAVQEALANIGVERMTVCDAQGYGQQRGGIRSSSPRATLLRKVALEIAVNEDFLDRTVETIARVAKSGTDGNIGDGKVFVLPVDDVIRLSDTVRGPEAVS
jgi:nitrogen regulatory protein PII